MIYKQNPMHILPDRRRTERMFRKMDFVVARSTSSRPTARMAG